MKRRSMRAGGKWLLGPLVILLAAGLVQQASHTVESGEDRESLKQLETAIHKAVMSCYATEGVYPPTLDYLKDHYGIQIDEKHYTVFYQIFADNIMPDITVMSRQGDTDEK